MAGYLGRITVYHTVQAFNEANRKRETWRQSKNLGPFTFPIRMAFAIEQEWARDAVFRLAIDRRLAHDPKFDQDLRHHNSVSIMFTDERNPIYIGGVRNATAPFWLHVFVLGPDENVIPEPPTASDEQIELLSSWSELPAGSKAGQVAATVPWSS